MISVCPAHRGFRDFYENCIICAERHPMTPSDHPVSSQDAREMVSTCRHCQRRVVLAVDGYWVDPEATGDDSLWRETCDAHDTFIADHEPSDG
jgi:hypothetical protein